MSAFTYDVEHSETRNRVTVAFRIILAIPHLIVSQVWGYLAQVLAVVQWFIILFTGNRNEDIWKLQKSWLEYSCRVVGYTDLLFDPYPAFGTAPGPVPVRSDIAFEGPANRLTSGLRLIWLIPALVIAAVFGIAAAVVVVISWFAIVITGRQPRGHVGLRAQVRALLPAGAVVRPVDDRHLPEARGSSCEQRPGK